MFVFHGSWLFVLVIAKPTIPILKSLILAFSRFDLCGYRICPLLAYAAIQVFEKEQHSSQCGVIYPLGIVYLSALKQCLVECYGNSFLQLLVTCNSKYRTETSKLFHRINFRKNQ